jgi:23S rRNA (guanosine2251-2'-O)-methyltransferase
MEAMTPPTRLYGIHPILEALNAQSRQFEGVYLQRGRKDHNMTKILHLAKSQRIPVDFIPREALDRIAGSPHHQGAVGVVAAKGYVSLEDLLTRVEGRQDALVLILDSIEDPHNLGAILRTAEGAGVDGVIIPQRRAIGLTATVAKTSAGAIDHIPVARVVNLSQTIEQLKKAGFWVYALDAKGSDDYTGVDYCRPLALVIGGEGRGVRALVAEHCDGRLHIPMRGRLSSLNASVAAGVLLYEVLRQRTRGQELTPGGSE